ncbi:MAG TPA: head-tail adaptor protein [Planctomicrobium sp.]|nr:head-tail adaptor protein [Planctomicrobium sp.]
MAVNARLNRKITFQRLRENVPKDEAGQVDDSFWANWRELRDRYADVKQIQSKEGYAQNQPQPSADWSVLCRGDDLTQSITHQDRIAFCNHEKNVTINITSIKTVRDVPHYIEFQGSEV